MKVFLLKSVFLDWKARIPSVYIRIVSDVFACIFLPSAHLLYSNHTIALVPENFFDCFGVLQLLLNQID
jgi:hypothetical protein